MVQWLFKMGDLISGSISLSRRLKLMIQLSIIIITRRKCPCYALGQSKFNALSRIYPSSSAISKNVPNSANFKSPPADLFIYGRNALREGK